MTAAPLGGMTGPLLDGEGRVVTGIDLPADGAGFYSGTVQFQPKVSGDHAFYTNNPAANIALRQLTAGPPIAICKKSVATQLQAETGSSCQFNTDGAPHNGPLKTAFNASGLQAGVTYLVDIGPVASNRPVQISAQPYRVPGNALLSHESSECVSDYPDPALCEAGGPTRAVTASFLGTPTAPPIEANVSYGVKLVEHEGEYEGSLTLSVNNAGLYRVYLGTPHVGFSLHPQGAGTRLVGTCEGVLPLDECSSSFRGVHAFQLSAGEYRLDLNAPLGSPVRWVRLLAAHEENDDAIPSEGLELWLRADRGVVVDQASSNVVAWSDQSTSANHATARGSQGGILQDAGGPNGQPRLRFVEGFRGFDLARPLALPEYSVLFVGESTTVNVDHSATVIGSASGPESYIRWQGSERIRVQGSAFWGGSFWQDTRVPHLSTVIYGHGQTLLYKNGREAGGAGYDLGSPTFAQIGSIAGRSPLRGDLAEVIVYSRSLDTVELSTVHDYLRAKYAF
jgi:hypothetical protein